MTGFASGLVAVWCCTYFTIRCRRVRRVSLVHRTRSSLSGTRGDADAVNTVFII